jgi:mannosyl-3-phosphoglycerate phosphatase
MRDDSGEGVIGGPLRIVFTDLDGTLLDAETYSWEAAQEALLLCRQQGVPVVLASSKTGAEMEIIHDDMGLTDPFISENGGGIFFPEASFYGSSSKMKRDGNFWKLAQGVPRTRLVAALKEIAEELGCRVTGFMDMDITRVASLTGLDIHMARLAAQREFDEPFIITEPVDSDIAALHRAAKERGLTITQGGRFFHIHGGNDKGKAMEQVISCYRQTHPEVISLALGDSPNDFSMLERADVPVLVRSKRDFPQLSGRIPGLVVTTHQGPTGWNEAVLPFLESKE